MMLQYMLVVSMPHHLVVMKAMSVYVHRFYLIHHEEDENQNLCSFT